MRECIGNASENASKDQIEASKQANEQLRSTNESLRKLKDKAVTPINYKHMSYEEMINIHLLKLKTTEFTPNEEMKKITTNTNINTEILKTIIKKKISNQDFNKLEIQVLIHVDHTIEDIIKFFFYKGLLLSKKIKRRFN